MMEILQVMMVEILIDQKRLDGLDQEGQQLLLIHEKKYEEMV